MLFKNQYGKGWVFFTQFPIEKMLSNRPGYFYEDDVPPYENIYKKLLSEIDSKRIAKTNHKFIQLTEHIVDDSKRYLFAINFSEREQTTTIDIPKEYRISTVWGEGYNNRTLTLAAGSGVLLVAKKDNI